MIADDATIDDATQPLLTEEQQQDAFTQGVLADIADTGRVFTRLLAEAAERNAAQHGDPETLRRLHVAHERTASGIRRTLLLAQHLKKPIKPTPAASGAPRATAAAKPENPETHHERRDRLERLDSIADLLERPLPEAIETLKGDVTCAFDELSKPIHKAGGPARQNPQPTPRSSPPLPDDHPPPPDG